MYKEKYCNRRTDRATKIGSYTLYSVSFKACEKLIFLYIFVSQSLGYFVIHMFWFAEYSRKIRLKSWKNQPNFEIFLKYIKNKADWKV